LLQYEDAHSCVSKIGKILGIPFVKDYRLYLIKKKRIIEVLHENEHPYQVMSNYLKKENKIRKMGTRKVRIKEKGYSWEDYLTF
jgi:hypothetical protein